MPSRETGDSTVERQTTEEPIGWSDLPQNQVWPTCVKRARALARVYSATVSSEDHVFEGCTATFYSAKMRNRYTSFSDPTCFIADHRKKEEGGQGKGGEV